VKGALAAVGVLSLLAAAACGGAPEPAPPSNARPGDVALALFALAAAGGEDDSARVAPFVDSEALDADPGGLFEALEKLADVRQTRVVASEPMEGLDRVVVDVEGERPGPSFAAFTIHAEPVGDGTWRVVWFAGPDGAWPPRRAPRGDGTRTSTAPGDGGVAPGTAPGR
jgi:hypothetical protein